MCFLKKGFWPENAPTPLANARCGFIPFQEWKVDANVFWADNCNFPGNELSATPNATPEQYRKMCRDDLFCDHFTFFNEDGTKKNVCYIRRKASGLL